MRWRLLHRRHWFMARMESPNWNRAGCGSAFRTPGVRSYYTPEERSCIDSPEQFLEVWTRKEAYLKRDGRGLSLPLRQINTLSIPGISTRVVNGFVVSLCGEPAEFSLVACRLEQFKKQDGENETTQRGLCYVGRTGPALEDGKRGVERL